MTAPRTPDAVLRRLDLKITRRLEGLLQGDHRTAFRGQELVNITLAIVVVISFFLLLFACWIFGRLEDNFAENI